MPRLQVAKMHGSRNAILVIDGAPSDFFTAAQITWAVQRLCAYRGGVGSDGVYFIKDTGDGAAQAWFFNPDGSPSLLCGNGMRCAGRLLLDRHQADEIVLHTGAYAFTVRAAATTAHGVRQVAVELPAVDFEPHEPIVANVDWPYVDLINPAYHPSRAVTALAVPNSHLITVVDRYDEAELIATGTRVAEDTNTFPIGANVSFVTPLGEAEVFIRTFERGAGLTESCGSGVSASRATLSRLGIIEPDVPVLVRNPGGPARSWIQQTRDVWQPILEGNATLVLRTELDPTDVLGSEPLEFQGQAQLDEISAFGDLFDDNLKILHAAGIRPAVG
ncbi:diaminopimelate epimerase [Streptomyces sp. 846.5]|nr:diaminopimelate epimerase [Streptomyces sp. 846.5]TDT94169.1 diaminopimelate epimerase [Streptomyces sp. 846.5]